MYKSQKGFTLVELIVVIVLLGILGVTALGKFQDLSGDAELAALEGIAAEISAASSINYAKSLISAAGPAVNIGVGAAQIDTTAAADACLDAAGLENLLTGDDIPDIGSSTTTVTADLGGQCAGGAGNTYTCTLNSSGIAGTADATIICTE